MKKRILCLALTVVMALGIVTPAVAAGPTFSDVPESHWAYADVEAAAAQGLMNGTGDGMFSPDMKVSVSQFLTLVGRVVFPNTKVTESDTWYGPYVTAAQTNGLLEGTQVDVNDVEAEITRYDMAVILRAAAKKLGVAEKAAQSSQVTDYGDVPTKYADAVLAVYGMGLIKGDQSGNFNGNNTMVRSEVVTVVVRLAKAKPGSGFQGGGKPTEPEQPTDPEPPTEEKIVHYNVAGSVRKTDHDIGRPIDDKHTYLKGTPLKLFYTPDGGKTSVLVAETVASPTDLTALYDLTFEGPESWGSRESRQNGGGFYFSAETEVDGQRLVTSDLRTDGRAYKDLFQINPGGSKSYRVELTPPDGEKARFTFQGHLISLLYPDHGNEPVPGFTIQLHLADGSVVAEALTQADGSFSMECAVDGLDGAFDRLNKIYYVTFSGYFDGELYERSGKYLNEDAYIFMSLVDLQVVDWTRGRNPNGDYRLHVYDYEKK